MQGKAFPHAGKNMAVFVHTESGRQWDLHWKLVVFLTDRCHHGLNNPEAMMVANPEE